MKFHEDRQGVMMVVLAITLAIIFILAGIGVNIGVESVKTTQDSKLTYELEVVQHAVLEQYMKYKTTKNKSYLVGNKMEQQEVEELASQLGITLVNIPDTYDNKDYYQLDKASLLEIGISNTDDEYVINYISGEVINITKKTTNKGTTLYVRANNFYQ